MLKKISRKNNEGYTSWLITVDQLIFMYLVFR